LDDIAWVRELRNYPYTFCFEQLYVARGFNFEAVHNTTYGTNLARHEYNNRMGCGFNFCGEWSPPDRQIPLGRSFRNVSMQALHGYGEA
jgi:hypothetical protein